MARIFDAHASISDPAERARVRLLSGFLAVAGVVALTRATVQSLMVGAEPSTPVAFGAFALFGSAFAAARTRHWRAGAAVAALVPTVLPLVIGFRDPGDPSWFAVTVVGSLLAATFFSLRVAFGFTLFSVLGVAAIIARSPGLRSPDRAIPILAFVIITAGLFVVIARHRDQIEAMHAKELREREQRRAQAERLEAIGRLAAGVAHDFNNLLSVVRANTELLSDSPDASTSTELLEEMRSAADRGTALIAGLLAFSNPRSREVTTFDLCAAVGELMPFLRRLVGEQIRLVYEPTEGACAVRADRGHLMQVVLNLVVNARDATPPGGTISIDVGRSQEGASSMAWIVVSDTGHGIPEHVRPRIFEPFFTTKKSGNGLGLAIISDHVRAMGGHIVLDSGVTVHVRTWTKQVASRRRGTTGPSPRRRGGARRSWTRDDGRCGAGRRRGRRSG